MQPERKKTALAFHAKDDCAEVRREVYKLLMQHEMRFFAVVREKQTIVNKVLERNKTTSTYRYHPNHLYDKCVSRLFKERLHKEESYVIQFSRRGNRPRTEALQNAIEQSRGNLRKSWVFCLSWTLSEIDELEYSSPPGVHDVSTQAVFPRAEGIDRSSPLARKRPRIGPVR